MMFDSENAVIAEGFRRNTKLNPVFITLDAVGIVSSPLYPCASKQSELHHIFHFILYVCFDPFQAVRDRGDVATGVRPICFFK